MRSFELECETDVIDNGSGLEIEEPNSSSSRVRYFHAVNRILYDQRLSNVEPGQYT